MKTTIKIILILALLASAGYGYWRWQQREEAGPTYRTAKVERGDIVQRISATGTITPLISVTVGSQVSGIISKIYVDFNSKVKEGELLAELNPTLLDSAVKQVEGDYLTAKANVTKAKLALGRAQDMFDKKIGPLSERDDAQANYEAALGSLKRAEGSLQRAKADLANTKIYSPVDGIVISRAVDVGQTVAASMSAPTLFVIAKDLTKMQINTNVDQADIGQVREEQQATFTVDAYPKETFAGQVMQVRNSPTNVQNVITYDVIVSVDNSHLKLKPGMTANVYLLIAEAKGVLRVPNAALRFRPIEPNGAADGTAGEPAGGTRRRAWKAGQSQKAEGTVWALNSNKPQKRPVELGINDGQFTEARTGVSEKEELVVGYATLPKDARGSNPFGGPVGRGMRRF